MKLFLYFLVLYFTWITVILAHGSSSKHPGRIQYHLQGHNGVDSYQFGYVSFSQTNPQSRHEERDETGHVRGYYSFKDPYGLINFVQYEASIETGFRVIRNYLYNPNTGKVVSRVKNNRMERSKRRNTSNVFKS